jgi:hypothetical protein
VTNTTAVTIGGARCPTDSRSFLFLGGTIRGLEGGQVTFLARDPGDTSHAVGQSGFLAISLIGPVAPGTGVAT